MPTSKSLLVQIFFILNCLCAFSIILISYPFMSHYWKRLGTLSADVAFVMIGLTLLPGIIRRFSAINMWPAGYYILVKLRRQVGISVYLLSIVHTLCSYILPRHTIVSPYMSDWMGIIALLLLTPLFLTSNNQFMNILRKRWYNLHSLIRIIVWLLFLHVLLKGITFWSIVMGGTALIDIASWIQYYHISENIFGEIQKGAREHRDKPKH